MKGREETFWMWLFTVRLSRLLLVAVPFLILVPLLTYWLLTSSVETYGNYDRDSADIARKVLGLIDFDHLSGPELKARIEELLRIKGSVQSELQKLEKKRQVILADLSELTKNVENLKSDVSKKEKELEKLKASIQQTRLAQLELIQRNTPDIKPPLPLQPSAIHFRALESPEPREICHMETCFDYSRCSLTSPLRVFLYNSESSVNSRIRFILDQSGSLISDPDTACIYIANLSDKDSSDLDNLSHWQGDGRNHVVLNYRGTTVSQQLRSSRAILVQPSFLHDLFRPRFDVVLPEIVEEKEPVWRTYKPLVPIARKSLLSYHGELNVNKATYPTAENIIEILKELPRGKTSDRFSFSFSCEDKNIPVSMGDFFLCDDEDARISILEESTFSLIISPVNSTILTSQAFIRRLYESLRSGNIPVILGTKVDLPFSEFLDWSRFSILLPASRVTELHYLLRSFPYTDLFTMKRQGRLVFENYFSDHGKVINSLLGLIRNRIQIPANPVKDTPSPSVFNDSFSPLIMESLPPDVEPEENLGPLEAPFASPSFRRNFTSVLSETSDNWNARFHALALYPYSPWEPILPTEAKFLGSGMGFRPICGGEGGSGKEFSQALGGNSPQEQFTVVMLTYERENVLISSLSRLYGLPYLNKVVVVWNSPKPPKPEIRWPDIGVPIEVIEVEENSLNNRFLPFSSIETEAILSVDDDSHLRHDEIIFGFRVWREHRDRLVGFPGRYHAWDRNHTSWNYNSNYSCELSMVLTGAAFYHKYYNYHYTYLMPDEIRDMVDELMNCEDLAMNFLISHITRQPPVKVTSRWTFRCPGCPVSLSEDDSHFQERHRCINHFSRIYGYNPLLYTQYRADSVLFKTRIPAEKSKCFKFI